MDTAKSVALLSVAFPNERAVAILGHYSNMVGDYLTADWEDCLAKSGKFVEATLKALIDHTDISVGAGSQFKVDNAINKLAALPKEKFSDTVRLTIPRGCRFIYDVASNRGGRHDSDEIDPNYLDATGAMNLASWVLAEMVRYSQRGAVDPNAAAGLVESLVAKRYPVIEEVDGRTYAHIGEAYAHEIALVLLAEAYPGRIDKNELKAALMRHSVKKDAARKAVDRIKNLVDVDSDERLRLLAPGLKHAEEILDAAVERSS